MGSHTQSCYAHIALWYHIPLNKKESEHIEQFVFYKRTQNYVLCFQMACTGEKIKYLLIPEKKKISTQASVYV